MIENIHEMSGPLLLLAGPGTGKTYQLAKRVKYLVEEKGENPDNIAVITFTSPAARNMRERISDYSRPDIFIPFDRQPKMICTMHSLGFRILRDKALDLGLTDSVRVVYSDRLRDILIGDAAQLAGFKREDSKLTARCRQFGNCKPSNDKACKICEQYKKILRCCSAIDHDDQILLACQALGKDSELLMKYQTCCKYLLVDEYQDINAGQFEFIRFLSRDQEAGLFVVGDDDQSIYSWRGGSPEFIRNFKEHFGKNAKIINLNKSFRCHPHVLDGAVSVVSEYDKQRLPKEKTEYQIKEGKKIIIHNVPSDIKEAIILRKLIESAFPSQSVLVLLPHRGFADPIVFELKKAKIAFSAPRTLPGEGLPLISTLSQWLKNRTDSFSFRECLEAYLNNAESGIPSKKSRKPEKLEERENAFKEISKLWDHILNNGASSLWNALELEKANNELKQRIFTSFNQLLSMKDNQENPSVFIAQVVRTMTPWKKIENLLNEIDTWVETTESEMNQSSIVRIMTLQGAKGLEADIVCIIGLEEDSLPRNSLGEDIVEQSRLMFVSMTRAKKELHIFHARKRSGSIMFKKIYEKGKAPDIHPSRFLDSIPKEHKENQFHPT